MDISTDTSFQMKLIQYHHGAGCDCKVALTLLEAITEAGDCTNVDITREHGFNLTDMGTHSGEPGFTTHRDQLSV